MKFWYILFTTFTLSFHSHAHEYFFGFAELAYDEEAGEYQGTLLISTHEIQDYLKAKDVLTQNLDYYIEDGKIDAEILGVLDMEIWKNFSIRANHADLTLKLVGFEILETGMTQFYFYSEKAEKAKHLDITFDLLMNLYPKQQNKLNYIDGMKAYTVGFLPNKTQSSIITE